ncbi:alcohol dehydrogenase catalytic domain-containing protein [Bacillus thuringiensis]|uniref:Zinc-binding dehydrogenase n=1 Tax=Bacillus thuringiensis TaxID=1428 RepID=A0AAW4HYI0_BACTU|nr:alcohol dehydrogenase catalytic domain-containing protein [Bacillus thuringiensis]MBN9900796.1 zinc-binding dehydrogenase [Bacillus thuringiensis]MDY7520224.1 alcohol dehydrogenase catalytic domain-containing protein [Bacillus thuringiensis]
MFGKSFKVVNPKQFELYIEEVESKDNCATVRIDTAAVCKADLRYYLGNRDPRLLALKYPMNLLHEAVGTVVKDPTGTFKKGQKVALVPNIASNCDKGNKKHHACGKSELGENYCPDALFASSNYNGFAREYVNYPVGNLVEFPEEIPFSIGVFSELISVCMSTIRRIKIEGNETIAVWGDGILGYILCSVLKQIHSGDVFIVGKNESKLNEFLVTDKFYIGEEKLRELNIDIAFECVGGNGAESAIEEIINAISIGGKIVLTGVSEQNVEINTRKILEKGLSMFGVTRSNVEDFRNGIKLFQSKEFTNSIEKLIIDEYSIKNIKEFYSVFELESKNRSLGKNLLKFNF